MLEQCFVAAYGMARSFLFQIVAGDFIGAQYPILDLAVAGEPVADAFADVDGAAFFGRLVAGDEDLDGIEVFTQRVQVLINDGGVGFSCGHIWVKSIPNVLHEVGAGRAGC